MMNRLLLTAALLTVLAAPAFSASTLSPGSNAIPPAPVAAKKQDRVLDIQTLKTPGGINLWLVEDHTLPVIGINFAFRSGASTDAADRQGVSQLLSNTLDEGAGDITSEQFQAALRDNAIDLGFSSSRDSFGGSMRTLVRHKDKALELLKLAVTSPRFDQEAVDRMKQANLTRIRASMSDPDWIGARIMNDRVFGAHPYVQNSGGTLASMAALTPEDLRAARARHFARDRLYVGIAGDVTAAEAARIVDDIFGGLPETAKTDGKVGASDMPAATKPVFYATPQPQTNLTMVWPGISIHDVDHYAGVVMDYIYGGGGFSSLLMNEVREAKGLTYGIYSDMMNMDHADRYTVAGSMLPQNVAPTIQMVRAIADRMRTTDVTAEQLQAAKDYLTGSMPLHFGSTMSVAGAVTGLQINNRPATALDDVRATIMAVTPADIRRVATRVFMHEPQVILVGAKPEGIDVETITTLPNVEGAPGK